MRLTGDMIKELLAQVSRENILLDPEFEFLRTRVYNTGATAIRFRGYTSGYRQDPRPNRKPSTFTPLMEQIIGEMKPSARHTVDHINRDWLDWRRENLRWATPSEQNSNQRRGKK